MAEKRVFLSLGSNLGEREQNLEHALRELEGIGVNVVARSAIYETEPQDVQNQPWFLNLVVECRTRFFPLQLLSVIHRIERKLGRERKLGILPKGPRPIDIDILLYGQSIVKAPNLSVPHPRLLDRRFVLAPLLEIDSSLRHPITKKPLSDHLKDLRGQIIQPYRN
jgi:2-amino-4-hydroxy-6-hydroxymethyldihydropteridine diphosphokinase